MKASTKLFAIILGATFLFSACKKDEASPTNSGGGNTTGSFTFKVDGTAITVDSARATLYTLGVPPNNREIDIVAFKGGAEVLEFHVLPRTSAQTAAMNFTQAWLTYKSGGTDYHSQSGTITLTTCDTTGGRFEGTFNFAGLGGSTTKNITDGNLLVTRFTRQ